MLDPDHGWEKLPGPVRLLLRQTAETTQQLQSGCIPEAKRHVNVELL